MTLLSEALERGDGLRKMKEMIAAQGGNPAVCDDVGLLPRAKVIREVTCGVEGYAAAMDTMALGTAAQAMGAGRLRKEDPIDYSVGFILRVRLGDHVFPGTPLCELHARSEEEADAAEAAVRAAIRWSGTPCEGGKNFYALVTPEGIREL